MHRNSSNKKIVGKGEEEQELHPTLSFSKFQQELFMLFFPSYLV